MMGIYPSQQLISFQVLELIFLLCVLFRKEKVTRKLHLHGFKTLAE